jgi:hypothetical protein
VVKDDSGKSKAKKKNSQQWMKTEIHQFFYSPTTVNISYKKKNTDILAATQIAAAD